MKPIQVKTCIAWTLECNVDSNQQEPEVNRASISGGSPHLLDGHTMKTGKSDEQGDGMSALASDGRVLLLGFRV